MTTRASNDIRYKQGYAKTEWKDLEPRVREEYVAAMAAAEHQRVESNKKVP